MLYIICIWQQTFGVVVENITVEACKIITDWAWTILPESMPFMNVAVHSQPTLLHCLAHQAGQCSFTNFHNPPVVNFGKAVSKYVTCFDLEVASTCVISAG